MKEPFIQEIVCANDDRGWALSMIPKDQRSQPVFELHAVSLEPAAVRGNHFHPAHDETIISLGGNLTLFCMEPGRHNVPKAFLLGPEPVLIRIPAGLAHAIMNRNDRVLVLICYANAPKPEAQGTVAYRLA